MCYFDNVFQSPEATVDTICHALNDPRFDRPECLVGSGVSGAVVLMAVSMRTGIPFAIVRKLGDVERSHMDSGSHSDRYIESTIPKIGRYVIIDDLISSGNTIRNIRNAVGAVYDHAQCVGIVLYQNFEFSCGNYEGIPLAPLLNDIPKVEQLRKQEMTA